MCQRKGIEQWQQCEAFFCIFPTQPEFDGEMDLRVFFYCGGQQIFYLVRIRQHSGAIVTFGQHWERASQVDICFLIIVLDEKSDYLFQLVGLWCNQLGNQVYSFPVILRTYIACVFTTDLTMFHTYKRGIVSVDATEYTGVCQPIYRVCIALERSEMYR